MLRGVRFPVDRRLVTDGPVDRFPGPSDPDRLRDGDITGTGVDSCRTTLQGTTPPALSLPLPKDSSPPALGRGFGHARRLTTHDPVGLPLGLRLRVSWDPPGVSGPPRAGPGSVHYVGGSRFVYPESRQQRIFPLHYRRLHPRHPSQVPVTPSTYPLVPTSSLKSHTKTRDTRTSPRPTRQPTTGPTGTPDPPLASLSQTPRRPSRSWKDPIRTRVGRRPDSRNWGGVNRGSSCPRGPPVPRTRTSPTRSRD